MVRRCVSSRSLVNEGALAPKKKRKEKGNELFPFHVYSKSSTGKVGFFHFQYFQSGTWVRVLRPNAQTPCEINPLSTKLYLYDLKTQFVPRSKHSLLRL